MIARRDGRGLSLFALLVGGLVAADAAARSAPQPWAVLAVLAVVAVGGLLWRRPRCS